ncbi:hypothetical protein [Actinacidiphila acididurans]|uniref:Uncharacterized protein n=1 Tax=Actinacidiphila acididurans TaxID=2784346 RepID=A0ABS2U2Z3_9ACTN|nr:hypothetical protein [Actinacidiphila acididurans]MBM9509970.1 hypothetical protein [Actinacidiphila acididurans]
MSGHLDTTPAGPFPPHLEEVACHLYLVFCEHLPFCGCGDPAAGYKLAHQILTLAPLYEDGRWRQAEELCGTPGAHQLVLAALTEAGLLEHGSSIGGSWITDRGRWVLWAVEQIGGIDVLEDRLDNAGFPHEWDPVAKTQQECTDACWTIPSAAEKPVTDDAPAVPEDLADVIAMTLTRRAAAYAMLPPWSPFRSPIWAPTPTAAVTPGACYEASFGRVHVKPGCRCERRPQ